MCVCVCMTLKCIWEEVLVIKNGQEDELESELLLSLLSASDPESLGSDSDSESLDSDSSLEAESDSSLVSESDSSLELSLSLSLSSLLELDRFLEKKRV